MRGCHQDLQTYPEAVDAVTRLPVLGMIGGGQLARMTHQAAISFGQSLRVLADSPADSAGVVAADVVVGAHTDFNALLNFGRGCDVVTFDHEHVDNDHVRALADAGVAVYPGADALAYAQNKLHMRQRLGASGFPMPRWAPVSSIDDMAAFGLPCVLKTASGGYDGKGVFLIESEEQARELLDAGLELLAEERVSLARELSVVVARSVSGQMMTYPVVETVQRDGICTEVLAVREIGNDGARSMATSIAQHLGVVGVMAVELFDTGDELLINELAMRPHNSGHWTIEGARTSQFEQHLRAVCDFPLGDTGMTAPAVAMANLLGGEDPDPDMTRRLGQVLAEDPGIRVHLYGKRTRPGRKIGHVTALGEDVDKLRRRTNRAAALISNGDE